MKTTTVSPLFFEFESDFVNTLKCVPMIVRYKLDSCGVKLKLHEWAKFSLADKESLAFLPCFSDSEVAFYGGFVKQLVREQFGYEASMLPGVDASWENLHEVPSEVIEKAIEWNCPPVSLSSWIRLGVMQRFALVKLSRSGHEGRNFPVACREFNLS